MKLFNLISVGLLVFSVLSCSSKNKKSEKRNHIAKPSVVSVKKVLSADEKAEVLVFAKEIEECFKKKDKTFLNARFNVEALMLFAGQGIDFEPDERKGFERDIKSSSKKVKTKLVNELLSRSAHFLYADFSSSRNSILFRHIDADGGFEYIEYFVSKRSGKWEIIDNLAFSNGQRTSSMIRALIIHAMPNQKVEKGGLVDSMDKISRLREAGKIEEALRVIERLPKADREQKSMIILEMTLMSDLPESDETNEKLLTKLEEYVALFPNDAGVHLLRFWDNISKEKWDGARKNLRMIGKSINDPYLNFYEAYVDIAEGKFHEAITKAKVFQKLEPLNEEAFDVLIFQGLELKNYKLVAEQMKLMEEDLGLVLTDIESNDDYAGFLGSTEGKELMKTYGK